MGNHPDTYINTLRRACTARGKVISLGLGIMLSAKKIFFESFKILLYQTCACVIYI